jgi:hypothetical protein
MAEKRVSSWQLAVGRRQLAVGSWQKRKFPVGSLQKENTETSH